MNIDSLRYFYAVAQGSTFFDAAESCNISQSSLSKSIQRLEDEFGVQLFDRHSRCARLTLAGERLLENLRSLLPAIDKMTLDMRDFSRRRRITCCAIPLIHGYASLLTIFKDENPDIIIDSRLETNYHRGLIQLARGELDFLCLHRPAIRRGQYNYQVLFEDRLQAVLPLDHPLAQKKHLRFADFGQTPLLLNEYMYPIIKDIATCMGLRLDLRVCTLRRVDTLHFIASGHGVSLLYRSDLSVFNFDGIAIRDVEEFPNQPFVLASSPRTKMTMEHLIFSKSVVSFFSSMDTQRTA